MDAPQPPVRPRRSRWTFQSRNSSHDGSDSNWTLPMAAKLYQHIDSLGPIIPLLRQIYCGIVSEEHLRGVGSTGIQHLKEDLSGTPITFEETDCWISAQELSYHTERRDELHELLKSQFRDVRKGFQLVSESSEMSLFLKSVLSKIDGPWVKHVSDVHSIIKHLSDDSGHEGTLQLHEVKDAVCYVSHSRTTVGPSFGARIRRRPCTFKRRQRVVTNGSSECESPFYITPRHQIVGPKRRLVYPRCAARFRNAPPPIPVCWIFDTGASFSATGDQRLLRGLHDAADISLCVASGAVLGSNKCGRISGLVNLSGVRYFPGMTANLISAGLFGTLGCETSLSKRTGCMILKDGHLIGGGRLLPDGTYSLDFLKDTLLGSLCPQCPH